jgi:hypothetical protein
MFFLFILITSLITSALHLHQVLAPFAQILHSKCIAYAPEGYAYELVKALVCGEPIQSDAFKSFFFKSSLYHLIVVSKTHFIFISGVLISILQKVKSRPSIYLITIFAISYSLMCNLQAPLVRSLITIALLELNIGMKLNLNHIKILMASALICLAINPLWLDSLSLLHSASCGLAFIVLQKMDRSHFQNHLFAYLLTLPFLFGWGSIHPIGLIINILITPILIMTWLPLAYLVFLIHPLMPLFDSYILFSINLLNHFLDPVDVMTNTHHIPSWILWCLFWAMALIANFRWQLGKLMNRMELLS